MFDRYQRAADMSLPTGWLASAVTRSSSILSLQRAAASKAARTSGCGEIAVASESARLPARGDLRRPAFGTTYINGAAKTPSRACRIWRTHPRPPKWRISAQRDGRNAVASRYLCRCGRRRLRENVATLLCDERGPPNELTLSSRRHEVLRGTADTGFKKARGGSAAEPR